MSWEQSLHGLPIYAVVAQRRGDALRTRTVRVRILPTVPTYGSLPQSRGHRLKPGSVSVQDRQELRFLNGHIAQSRGNKLKPYTVRVQDLLWLPDFYGRLTELKCAALLKRVYRKVTLARCQYLPPFFGCVPKQAREFYKFFALDERLDVGQYHAYPPILLPNH